MKLNKKLIVVTLILLFLLILNTVSATTDTTQEDVVKSDATHTETISHTNTATDTSSEKVAEKSTSINTVNEKSVSTDKKEETDSDSLSSTPDNDVLKADEKTFSELRQNIIDAGKGDTTITLNHNYIQDGDSEIEIKNNQKITIHGNGHTLDANGKSRIFLVRGGELILENLKIINGYTLITGAAILTQQYSNITIINCTFLNNTAKKYGGAIDIANKNTVTITNSQFINNTNTNGETYGAAIYIGYESQICLLNNLFKKNHDYFGRTIYNNPNSIISGENNIFIDNGVGTGFEEDDIGARTVPEGSFSELYSILTTGPTGPKILAGDYTYDTTDGSPDSSFSTGIPITNKVTIDGNGYHIDGSKTARIFYITGSNVILRNINFINGKYSYGGAIHWIGNNGRIENCNFTNNTATNLGGTVYWGELEPITADGGEIAKNGTIINSKFINNIAEYDGGAIYWVGNDGNITNCYFKKNNANTEAGAIYWKGHNGIIQENCEFIDNTATNLGGAIYWHGYNGKIINNCNFINNSAYSLVGDGFNAGGGAIYWYGESSNITNCSFTNNYAYSDTFMKPYKGGGAIHFANTHNYVFDCIFMNNFANNHGSAIWLMEGVVSECIFLNNTADFDDIIYASTSLTSNYNWFGNNATNYDETASLGGTYTCDNWLFLNATATPDTLQVGSTNSIVFKLSLYNSISNKVSEYDNSQLKSVNLTIISTNGDVEPTIAGLGDTITYKATNIGTGSVTASISDVSCTVNLKINKITTNIEVNTNQITLTVGDTGKINANLNPTSTGTLKYVSNDTSIVSVDNNGNIKCIGHGNAKITVSATVESNYEVPDDKTILITVNNKPNPTPTPTPTPEPTVKKLDTKILAKQKTFKTTTKNKKYTITLKTSDNKLIKKAKVTLKVKGKTYKAKTNNKGVATFKITKLNKKGKYTATITLNGDKTYKKSSKKVKITVKKAFKTIGPKSKNKKMVKKIQKSLKKKGYYRHTGKYYLKIDGLYYTWTTKEVKRYQKNNNLPVTGKIDEKTAAKLEL